VCNRVSLFSLLKVLREDKPLETLLRECRLRKAERELHTYAATRGIQPTLLDFGCGFNCLFLRRIGAEIRKAYGIDPKANDPEMERVEVIRDLFRNRLPFKSGFFDIITCLAVLEHVELIDLLLGEFYRELKDRGLLIMTVPTNKSEGILRLLARVQLLNSEEIDNHKRYLSPNSVKRVIEGHGFRSLKVKPFQFRFNCLYVFDKLV